MNIATRRLRLFGTGAVLAALGLIFSTTPAQAAITYEKKLANWASGNDAGGRDASARLVTSGGTTHYKALFRAYDEKVHVYDYYKETPTIDTPGYAEVNVFDRNDNLVERRAYGVWWSQDGWTYELDINGNYDIPEGYKIQLRMCVDGGSCTGWVYGVA